MFVIQKVSVDERKRIDRVQWQRLDDASRSLMGSPEVVAVREVVHELRSQPVGTVVCTRKGATKLGPYVRPLVDRDGTEGIEDDFSDWCDSSLFDLPRL
jgi:hypothetical protein